LISGIECDRNLETKRETETAGTLGKQAKVKDTVEELAKPKDKGERTDVFIVGFEE